VIAHVVLLKPRPDLTGDERREFIAAFRHALDEAGTVRGVRIGTRVMHGAGYESRMRDTAEYLAVIEFDDVEGLQAYLHHPSHVKVSELFGRLLTSALVFDFELDGQELLTRLIDA